MEFLLFYFQNTIIVIHYPTARRMLGRDTWLSFSVSGENEAEMGE
jgi:hypothetical protein